MRRASFVRARCEPHAFVHSVYAARAFARATLLRCAPSPHRKETENASGPGMGSLAFLRNHVRFAAWRLAGFAALQARLLHLPGLAWSRACWLHGIAALQPRSLCNFARFAVLRLAWPLRLLRDLAFTPCLLACPTAFALLCCLPACMHCLIASRRVAWQLRFA